MFFAPTQIKNSTTSAVAKPLKTKPLQPRHTVPIQDLPHVKPTKQITIDRLHWAIRHGFVTPYQVPGYAALRHL